MPPAILHSDLRGDALFQLFHVADDANHLAAGVEWVQRGERDHQRVACGVALPRIHNVQLPRGFARKQIAAMQARQVPVSQLRENAISDCPDSVWTIWNGVVSTWNVRRCLTDYYESSLPRFALFLIASCAISTRATCLFDTQLIPRTPPASRSLMSRSAVSAAHLSRAAQHARQRGICAPHCAQQTAQEPAEPGRHVQRDFLVASSWL